MILRLAAHSMAIEDPFELPHCSTISALNKRNQTLGLVIRNAPSVAHTSKISEGPEGSAAEPRVENGGGEVQLATVSTESASATATFAGKSGKLFPGAYDVGTA